MCTMIGEKIPIQASAKGGDRWFRADHAYIAYDHPTHAPLDHAIGLDFVREAALSGRNGLSGRRIERIAVELSLADARALQAALARALQQAADHETG